MKKLAVFLSVLSLFLISFLYAQSTQEDEVVKVLDNLHWLGHDSFRLDGTKTIYFDPWKLSAEAKKAGLIFITHEHYDHYSPQDIRLVSTKDTVIITTRDLAAQLESENLTCKEIKALLPGDSINILGIKISAVASYNTNKQFHPKSAHKLGFIADINGVKIYHAGDTDKIPEMANYACDVALLPVSGTYVMTAKEAAEAALIIKPKVAIPMHYADIVGTKLDAEEFRDLLKGKIEVKILRKGD